MTKKKLAHEKEKMGRPSEYTPELAEYICQLISTHACSVHTLIEMYALPDHRTIYNWLNTYPDFFHNYMQAKHNQAHILADEILKVPENIPTYFDKEGTLRTDNGMLGVAKLKIEALRWSAARLAPKHYGDNKATEVNNKEVDQDIKKRYQEMDEKNKKEC